MTVLKKAVPAAKKSPSKSSETRKLGQVEVLFAAAPLDFLHFNRYSIEQRGDFFEICFWYEEMDAYPVFRGMILKQDLTAQIPPLKRYIEKIGVGAPSKSGRGVRWDCAPVAFNIIDCVSREAAWGEIVIRKFSHKSVTEAASENGHVTGITHGAYISTGLLHRAFVMELIKLATVSP